MKILAIETSCDETAVSVIEASGDINSSNFKVLGDALFSQASKHAEYGGVFPTLAKREHQKNLVPLTEKALKESRDLKKSEGVIIYDNVFENVRDEEFKNSILEFLNKFEKPNIGLIVVTKGPGLEPALWTGINFAESISTTWKIPLIGIDHMEGHIMSGLVEDTNEGLVLSKPDFPILALLISGGHTELVSMGDWFKYQLLGRTKDDAVGEAFDKVARLLGLPYPGGPQIDAYAKRSREKEEKHDIVFPRPLAHDDTCDFSFSGLKTAVLYKLEKMGDISEEEKENVAEAFEDAVRDVIVLKTKRALEKTGAKTFVVGGGVSANKEIRNGLENLIKENFPNVSVSFPGKGLTGDNAVMIGIAGYLRSLVQKPEREPLTAKGSQTLS